jgi:putative transposase
MAQRSPPSDQKKANACRGVVLWEDEASFWLDGTLHQTWSRIGNQPRVDTFGWRRTAHVFGAIALHDASFSYRFEELFNGASFLRFLKQLVRRYRRQKVFLVIDNGPWHRLYEDGQRWLHANAHRIELHRLPPYSPEFNPMEGVWKTTRRTTTHNRFFSTTHERDTALRRTFRRFQQQPYLIEPQVVRFR